MKKPTEAFYREVKDNGCMGKTIRKFSYVATLCKKGGSEVQAIRMEYFQNKLDVHKAIGEQYPDWKIKCINKLYEEDFDD